MRRLYAGNGMSDTPPNRNRAIIISNILFALAIVAAGVVAYLYFFDDTFFSDGPEAPVCETSSSELACVVNALKLEDFDEVDYGRYTASADQLSQPGQVVEIDDMIGFVFVYPAASPEQAIADREAEGANLDPETVQITSRTADQPLNEGKPIHVAQHSNIIFILVGGTDDDIAKVQEAIETLP